MPMWQAWLSGALCAIPIAAAFAGPPIDAARRAELTHLVRHDCGSCHGMTLKGGLGSPLLPANLAHYSNETVAGFILDGVPGTPMPPWRGDLSAEDALWIATRLKEGFSE